jgi:hypothetical protein
MLGGCGDGRSRVYVEHIIFKVALFLFLFFFFFFDFSNGRCANKSRDNSLRAVM